MQYIVDAALAVLIIINTVRGYRKGLVKTVFGLASVIIALITAYLFGSCAGEFIRSTDAYEDICISTEKKLAQYFEEQAESNSAAAYEKLSESAFIKQLENMGVDTQKELDKYTASLEDGADNASAVLSESVALPVLEALSNVLGTVIVFVAVLLICYILSVILSGLFRLSFLRPLNTAGGLILGFVLGVFYAFVLCMVIKSILPCIPENPVIYTGMENDTVLYGFLSRINPFFLLLFGKFF